MANNGYGIKIGKAVMKFHSLMQLWKVMKTGTPKALSSMVLMEESHGLGSRTLGKDRMTTESRYLLF